MVQTEPERLLVSLLKNEVSVKDDSDAAISGLVSGGHLDKKLFANVGWQVTVGPSFSGPHVPSDIGAAHWSEPWNVDVHVWVLMKRGLNYTPERVRWDLERDVQDTLKTKLVDPASDVRFLVPSGWLRRDEPEENILHSILSVVVTISL